MIIILLFIIYLLLFFCYYCSYLVVIFLFFRLLGCVGRENVTFRIVQAKTGSIFATFDEVFQNAEKHFKKDVRQGGCLFVKKHMDIGMHLRSMGSQKS